jgi:hypothetical protein
LANEGSSLASAVPTLTRYVSYITTPAAILLSLPQPRRDAIIMSELIAGLATDLVSEAVNANLSPDDALTEFLGAHPEEHSSARLAILTIRKIREWVWTVGFNKSLCTCPYLDAWILESGQHLSQQPQATEDNDPPDSICW